MGERWLHDSLNLLWFAMRSDDPQIRRQGAAVCRALLGLLEDTPPLMPSYPMPMPPPASRIDLRKLLPVVMPAVRAFLAGDWQPLIEVLKPLVAEELAGEGFKMPFAPVPGATAES